MNEATLALALSSAALFRRNDDAAYIRVLACGWPEHSVLSIDHEEKLVLTLESEWEPLRIAETGWQHTGVPTGTVAPVLAVPLIARQALSAFVLYGPHSNGADIDPEEVQRLFHLCRAAQATYDELQVETMMKLIEELRNEVTRLQNGAVSMAAAKGAVSQTPSTASSPIAPGSG